MSEKKRFKKSKEESLERAGTTQVIYREMSGDVPTSFKIIAEARGVFLKGESDVMHEISDLDEFAYFVSQAWQEHLKLRKHVRSQIGLN